MSKQFLSQVIESFLHDDVESAILFTKQYYESKFSNFVNEIASRDYTKSIEGTEHTHEVRDNLNGGKVVGKHKSLRRAHRSADKKELEYGGTRYSVHPIKKD